MKCKYCIKEGKTSELYQIDSTSTLKPVNIFYDTNGKKHYHDPNIKHIKYKCSEGHIWIKTKQERCWCGWPDIQNNN